MYRTVRGRHTEYGGYDVEFVEGVNRDLEDMYICKICHLLSRDAQLTVCCGHTFCKSCLDRMKHNRTRSSKMCPVCRDNKKFTTVPNKQVDRKIRSLHVVCVNKEKGCEWQGKLNDLDVHIFNESSKGDGCMYEDVECNNGCGETIQRQFINTHMATDCPCRKIDCQHCNLSGTYGFITGDHMKVCPKVVIPCPNHCDTNNILREDMDEHRKVCSREIVNCKYMRLGCGTRVERKEVERHGKEKVEEHLTLAIDRLEKLENIVSQLIWSSYLASELASSSEVSPVFNRIVGFTNKRNERTEWNSPYFYTEDGGYEMYVRVTFASSYLKVHMLLEPNKDDDLSWPFRGRFDVMILNQISDTEHYLRTIVYDDRCSDHVAGRNATHPWGFSRFISYNHLCLVRSTCQYVKDDSIYIKVSYCGPEHDSD